MQQIVIELPDETYNNIIAGVYDYGDMNLIIKNGTPLPKGHGRLGDLDKIKKEMQNYYDDCAKTSEYTRLGFETAITVVEDTLTIIEADTKSEDEG